MSGKYRYKKDSNEQTCKQCDNDGKYNTFKQCAHSTKLCFIKNKRDKDTYCRQVAGNNRHDHCLRAEYCSNLRLCTARTVSTDVFKHDDRNIDYHADTENKTR